MAFDSDIQTMPCILIIEDEAPLRKYLSVTLQAHGFDVAEAATGAEGRERLGPSHPDLVLLDLGLPDEDGLDLARDVRRWSQVPILVVSARGKEGDKVKALEIGVDDYLTKPFQSFELMARIRAILQYPAGKEDQPANGIIEAGHLHINLAGREVLRDGEPISLSQHEYDLLAALARHPGRVLTYAQLLHEAWGCPPDQSPEMLRIFMTRLRRKVEPDPVRPRVLITEPGIGYRLRVHPLEASPEQRHD